MKSKALSVAAIIATAAFYCMNGGEDAPIYTQAVVLVGIIISLVTMPIKEKEK